jgi:hypothetical protein
MATEDTSITAHSICIFFAITHSLVVHFTEHRSKFAAWEPIRVPG